MNVPESPIVPLAYAAELSFELALMRNECSQAARLLVARQPLDEISLEECAQLDEAVAHAQRHLQAALERIQSARNRRTSHGGWNASRL
jgi:hypothetical protein